MGSNVIDAGLLKRMFLAGVANLESKKEWINELNVFPVPDGDTGTNMTLTILSAAREVNSVEEPTMETLAKAISSGSLRGARGNSGVILSQLFRGFTKAIKYSTEIDMELLAEALQRATETAYKAVMKPKEGTILTVASGIATKAAEMAEETDDLEVFIPAVIAQARVNLLIDIDHFYQSLALASPPFQLIRDHLNFAAYFCDFRQNISQGINRLAVFNIEMNRDLSCYHPPVFSHHPFGD